MSGEQWIQLGVKYCEKVGDNVELMEKRVYPQGLLATGNEQYRVLMRRCSAGYQCSHLEEPCVWVDAEADGRQYNT